VSTSLVTRLERRAATLETFLSTCPTLLDTATIGGAYGPKSGLCVGEVREVAALLREAIAELNEPADGGVYVESIPAGINTVKS
jgi:hypothetical protein